MYLSSFSNQLKLIANVSKQVRQSNAACQNGDFATAVALYTDALQLDPTNHILYSNRSAAKLKQGLFAQAYQDATTARDLCPTWPKAYYRFYIYFKLKAE